MLRLRFLDPCGVCVSSPSAVSREQGNFTKTPTKISSSPRSFQSNSTGRSHVYRCAPDGNKVTNLTAGDRLGKRWRDAYGYALSRDGRRLLYTVHDGSTGRVVLADADGGNPRLLFPDLGYIYMGALSPARDRVVVSGPARGYRLLVADLPNGEPEELTPDHPDCYVPQFTPDGKAIIFIRRDGDIYRVGADGKNLRRLTEGNNHVEFRLSAKDQHGSTDGPHLSPDGTQIAYVAVFDPLLLGQPFRWRPSANFEAAWWSSTEYFIWMRRKARKPGAKPSGKKWFVYLLRCADGTLYTGIANDVSRRRQQHNAGTASRYTRSRLPVKLVYQEAHASRASALRREAAIKALPRRQKESIILQAVWRPRQAEGATFARHDHSKAETP
jgi:predicted GIY-YIG superfamily endonuclease/Tol biopolymer transport system component